MDGTATIEKSLNKGETYHLVVAPIPKPQDTTQDTTQDNVSQW